MCILITSVSVLRSISLSITSLSCVLLPEVVFEEAPVVAVLLLPIKPEGRDQREDNVTTSHKNSLTIQIFTCQTGAAATGVEAGDRTKRRPAATALAYENMKDGEYDRRTESMLSKEPY